MIRIAIVEDDRHDREALKKCLNRYEKENQMKFSVTEFQDGEDIVTDYTASYDLIILDIEMAFLNGMKAAEKIRECSEFYCSFGWSCCNCSFFRVMGERV